ncbi:hypothetical protein [Sediminitomix flava]|uniref:Uncharacterized protein n=1 Tax=Sediminitomix flava TaxID=379075 RepID=A0A315ZA16_SEDFL|nr:hypothetical protein [Sediminitomix flava]PWJ42426.1 hypothetical protein BC781_103678 [Sediminitomix flava]
MSYPELFKDLVQTYNPKSESFLDGIDRIQPNPYYLGFGFPDSKILIIGQEKAIDPSKTHIVKNESMENLRQWDVLIEEEIDDVGYHYYGEEVDFKNPLHPYKKKGGKTWGCYEKLLKSIYPELSESRVENTFFLKAFITEVNSEVSKTQLGNKTTEERRALLKHDFYKSFPVTLLAFGDYMGKSEIQDLFEVDFVEDLSIPNEKLVVFKDSKRERLIIQSRQFSNAISDEYIKEKVAKLAKEHLS